MFVLIADSKFAALTWTEYVPGMIAPNWYPPSSFVVTTRVTLVALFFRVTVAPAMAAPLGSLTTPTIEPVSICAWITEGRRKEFAKNSNLTVCERKRAQLPILTPPENRSPTKPQECANVIMNPFFCKHDCARLLPLPLVLGAAAFLRLAHSNRDLSRSGNFSHSPDFRWFSKGALRQPGSSRTAVKSISRSGVPNMIR